MLSSGHWALDWRNITIFRDRKEEIALSRLIEVWLNFKRRFEIEYKDGAQPVLTFNPPHPLLFSIFIRPIFQIPPPLHKRKQNLLLL